MLLKKNAGKDVLKTVWRGFACYTGTIELYRRYSSVTLS